MLYKIIIVVFFLAIVYSLFSAFYYMVKGGEGDDDKMLRRLSWRIGLSLLFFFLLLIGMKTGVITPHPITPGAVYQVEG
ncbi:MAG: twin transmembrane helix small protein [Xanthomonadales bacterium]|nr:twin transmembrane helix small protein [Xanthomonadales bacterium]